MNNATTTQGSIETFRSGDEWVCFTATADGVRVETSDGEDSLLAVEQVGERKAWIATWGYRLAA